MSVIEKKTMLCYRCMEEHEVQIVTEPEYNIFKGERVEYPATYFYCDRTDAYYSDGPMLNANDIAMKDAYRAKKGLLTSREIVALRQSYGVSQKDLAIILSWGEKTITRYESHQVQDAAYDAVLRRLDEDPEWYLQLLRKAKEQFSERTYQKYLRRARDRYAEREDTYRRKAIAANYASIGNLSRYSGNTPLDLDAVVNVVQYFADYVQNLFKVKLMKLMWYADALSYKRRGRTITGLAYQAMAMGAVPFAHDEIMELDGISYKEVDKGDGYIGYRFLPREEHVYPHLSEEDMDILADIVRVFGPLEVREVVHAMHQEAAFLHTRQKSFIRMELAEELSLN